MGDVATILRKYGYQIKNLDETTLNVKNSSNNLDGVIILYGDTFLCILKLFVGGRVVYIIHHKEFMLEEIDKVLPMFKVAIDDVNKTLKTSELFVDSLPPAGNEKNHTAIVNEYVNHFKVNYGKTKYFHGLTHSLSICLNDSLNLMVRIESDDLNKLVYSKFLTESNYKDAFDEVDELIKQFKKNCDVSNKLINLSGE